MVRSVNSRVRRQPTTPGRSRNMAAIRSWDTKAELLLRKCLRATGLFGYRCNYSALPGKPDVVFTRYRVAVFVDGAYWHGHPKHFTFGRFGRYWDTKIRRTQRRDREQQAALKNLGYRVIRFWDFQVIADSARCSARIRAAVSSAQARGSKRRTP